MRSQDSEYTTLPVNPVVEAKQNAISEGIILRDRYILEKKVASGGMGHIYRARDLRAEEHNLSDYRVAIKILNPLLFEHLQAQQSLHREALQTRLLNHPNIVNVYDYDRDGDINFIVMEYLKGITLDKLIQNVAIHGLSYHQRLAIVSKVAEALSYAHNKNVIHGDLKPSNIFIVDNNVVKLIDFGLSRGLNAIDNNSKNQLHAYTPAYASIEKTKHLPLTAADDVYAFCCLSYELLCNEHPYERLSADIALQKKLVPKKIHYMPAVQSNAIVRGLSLERSHRNITMLQLLDSFIHANKRQIKIISWTLSIVVVMLLLLVANQIGPINLA